MKRKPFAWTFGLAAALALAAYLVLDLSPWPSAFFYRAFMDRSGEAANVALARHVPAGITAVLGQQYDAKDADAVLDVYSPAQPGGALPTVVWIHGGGFFAGSRGQVANYLKILAGKGYTAVAVGYSLGPMKHYPTPVLQVNAALGYLVQNAERLRVDPARLFLAGDSAGAQLAAQVANVITSPSYAATLKITPSIARSQLRGAILHCGVYDLALTKLDGGFGHFMHTA